MYRLPLTQNQITVLLEALYYYEARESDSTNEAIIYQLIDSLESAEKKEIK